MGKKSDREMSREEEQKDKHILDTREKETADRH